MDMTLIEVANPLAITALMVLAAVVIGRLWLERKHLRTLAEREARLRQQLTWSTLRKPTDADPARPQATLVVGEAVQGCDYLRVLVANFVQVFGGEIKGFTLVMQRARREATCRALEQAVQMGYTGVANLRLDGMVFGVKDSQEQGMSKAAVLVSGTAYHRLPD